MSDDAIQAGAKVLAAHPLLQDDPSMICDHATCVRVVRDILAAVRKTEGRSPTDDDLAALVCAITAIEENAASAMAWEDKYALIFKMGASLVDPLLDKLGLKLSVSTLRDSYERETLRYVDALRSLRERIQPALKPR